MMSLCYVLPFSNNVCILAMWRFDLESNGVFLRYLYLYINTGRISKMLNFLLICYLSWNLSICRYFLPLLVICFAGKLDEVYSKLVDANPNMVVYKKEDIPEHFHYRHNARITPILVEAKEGWTIMQNRTGPFMCTYSNLMKLCGDNWLVAVDIKQVFFSVVLNSRFCLLYK